MALESEASSNEPGRADQPSCWQHLTGMLLSTRPLRLPALYRHTQGTGRAGQPLGSKWHSTAEEPVGCGSPQRYQLGSMFRRTARNGLMLTLLSR